MVGPTGPAHVALSAQGDTTHKPVEPGAVRHTVARHEAVAGERAVGSNGGFPGAQGFALVWLERPAGSGRTEQPATAFSTASGHVGARAQRPERALRGWQCLVQAVGACRWSPPKGGRYVQTVTAGSARQTFTDTVGYPVVSDSATTGWRSCSRECSR